MPTNFEQKDFDILLESIGEVGYVEIIFHPVIRVVGLPKAKTHELVLFENGVLGIVLSLDAKYVDILLLSKINISVGSRVVRTDKFMEFPVGAGLLSKSLDPFGRTINSSTVATDVVEYRNIDLQSPSIAERARVTESLLTGVTVVDLLIPLGKGQRELIIGDRKTGKTEFILQTILSQAQKGAICIYAGIGKRKSEIKLVEKFINEKGIQNSTVLVLSASTDPLGLIYIAPYAAMTLAEYYKDQGKDVVLILDDLTTHAKFYREISLINRKFPGRSSYPGDIFYTHARLLERAGNFKHGDGTASITCLPLAETIAGDISGYIQTNLMSITDGHIYFDKSLFEEGRRPSVNYFLSVTRVGRQTQSSLHWGVNRELSSFLTLLEKSKTFAHFGSEVNDGIKATMAMGDRITSFFDQPMGVTINIEVQIITFALIWVGALNNLPPEKIKQVILFLNTLYRTSADFKSNVDILLNESKTFNDLLGKVSMKSADLLSYLSGVVK